MIDLEKQKLRIANHKAEFVDYGNIKILDFKNPKSNEYRIRFLFEEDYCRLHISGDLGELIATNYRNMTFEGFKDFAYNPGYFEEKIDCHSRDLYFYSDTKAKNDIIDYFGGVEELKNLLSISEDYGYDYIDDMFEDFFSDVFDCFDDETGISQKGMDTLAKFTEDEYSLYEAHFGRERTGIIELYLMMFNAALEKINQS